MSRPAGAIPRADPRAVGPQIVGPLPLAFRVAIDSVPTSFVDDQITAANTLFAPHDIAFVEVSPRGIVPEEAAALETREHRDALAKYLEPKVVNVFIVHSLRDVDDPTRFRMGVTWRNLKDLQKKYVVVSKTAAAHVLAHELGHFFGLGHSSVKNNLMSYDREDGKLVFVDAAQGRTARATARALLASGSLAARARIWKKADRSQE